MGTPTFPFSPTPSLAGFIDWFYPITGTPPSAIPTDSVWFVWAYNTATGTVNQQIQNVPGPFWLQAIYNLAADFIFEWAPDVPNAPPFGNISEVEYPYFAYYRKFWDLNGFVAGVINSSADNDTSESLQVPKALANLTLGDLQLLKTPWGRAYLAIAQKVGTLWGLNA